MLTRQHPQVLPKVVAGVLELLRRRRCDEAADGTLLAAMVTMLRELGLYSSALEPRLLEQTAEHYKHEGV